MNLSIPRPGRLAALAAAAVFSAGALCAYFGPDGAQTALFAACLSLFAGASALRPGRHEAAGAALFAALFALMRTLGLSYDRMDSYGLIFKNAGTMLAACAACLSLFAAAWCAALLGFRLLRHLGRFAVRRSPGDSRTRRALFFGCALVLLLGSLPYLLLYAPGLNIADTRDQLLQFFGLPSYIGDGSVLTDHHPVLTTWIYGLFIRLGLRLGSANLGQLIFSLCQLALLSLCTAHMLVTLYDLGASAGFCRGVAIFLALWPVTALYAFNMCKDVTVLPCVMLLCSQMLRLAFPRGGTRGPLFFVGLAVNCLLLIALRKSAFYALGFSLLLLLPAMRGARLRLGAALLGAMVLFTLYSRVLLPAAGVAPGETREMLSIPFQQAARAQRDRPERITETERAAFARVIDVQHAGESYDPRLADPVKDAVSASAAGDDLAAFARAWLSVGARCPSTYLQAWLNMIYGYFYPSESNTIVCLTLNSPEAGALSLTQDPSLSGVRLALHNLIYYRLRRLPALGALFYADTAAWAFLFLLAFLCVSGGYRAFAPWGFFLGTLAICLLSPKSGEIRYLLPVLYALPAMLGAALLAAREKGERP